MTTAELAPVADAERLPLDGACLPWPWGKAFLGLECECFTAAEYQKIYEFATEHFLSPEAVADNLRSLEDYRFDSLEAAQAAYAKDWAEGNDDMPFDDDGNEIANPTEEEWVRHWNFLANDQFPSFLVEISPGKYVAFFTISTYEEDTYDIPALIAAAAEKLYDTAKNRA